MSEAVKYGYGYGMQPGEAPSHTEFLGFAGKVEQAGFDSFWLDDHIAFRGNFLESLAALAAAAARTERITLGSLVYLLPLRRPAIAAKAAATVDYLSGGGRFIFGVGVGGEEAREFEVCGVARGERGARTDEAIEVLRKLWSGEAVSHEGRFFRFTDARQSPAPLSPGGPPIWVGGRSEAAQRRAALLADGYAPYLFSPARYEKALACVRRLAAEAGRALDDPGKALDARASPVREPAGKGERCARSRCGKSLRKVWDGYARCGEEIPAAWPGCALRRANRRIPESGRSALHLQGRRARR